MPRSPTVRVLIAGGGVAAIEAMLALRVLAGQRVAIDLLSPDPVFTYAPVSVAEPFGRGKARRFPLATIADDQGAVLHTGSLAAVDPIRNHVLLHSGEELPFDVLVLALGARQVEAVPGALTFGGPSDVPPMEALLGQLERGEVESVAFAVPCGVAWPLPAYELACLTAARAPERDIVLVTWEHEPLSIFGGRASRAVADLLAARGIRLRMGAAVVAAEDGAVRLASGGRVSADGVVALPHLEGRPVVGLPSDRLGFIPVDAHGKVAGLSDVYAAGDATSFPLKQGGIAAQQADAVAAAIAARAGAAVDARPFQPVLRGLLITGGEPLYLRAEDFARSDDAHGRAAPTERESVAGRSALWWPPAKIAGRYLAPYLATARPVPLGASPLRDRATTGAPEGDDADPFDLTLLLADHDARWGDYDRALHALEAAEALAGQLPSEYEARRRRWEVARARGAHAEPLRHERTLR